MMPRWHLLFGFVFSYVLVYFFNFTILSGSMVFLSSILIDLDHVLIYFIDKKNLNPWKFWDYSMEKKKLWESINDKSQIRRPHFILHGVEFVLLLFIFYFLNKIFLYIVVGIIFHITCDLIILVYRKEHVSFKISQIWLWHRNKNKKNLL